MKLSQRTNNERSGFTLIELLVVVAIVGILAGMLMPALTRARNTAKSATCINNLRQWMIATHLYMDDNNEYIPFDSTPVAADADKPIWAEVSAAANVGAWFNVLPPYVNKPAMSSFNAGTSAELYSNGGILQCPGAKWVGNEASATGPSFSYAFNSKLFTSSHPLVQRKDLESPPLDAGGANVNSRAVNASTVAMLVDTRCSTVEPKAMAGISSNKAGSPHTYSSRMGTRHNLRANVAFFDGSVRTFDAASLMDSTGKNIATSQVIWKPWNPDDP